MRTLKTKTRALLPAVFISFMILANLGITPNANQQVLAQSSEAVSYCAERYGPGSSAPVSRYNQCLEEYAEQEQICNDTWGVGNGSWFTCLEGIPDLLDAPDEPSDDELCRNTGGNPFDGDAGRPGGCACPAPQTFVSGEGCTTNTGEPGAGSGASGDCPTNTEPTCYRNTGTDPAEDIDATPVCEDGSEGVDVAPTTSPDGCLPTSDSLEDQPIFTIIGNVIQFLLASVGIGLTAVVVSSGYKYMAARGNPEETAKARDRIGFALVGMIMFALASVVINWLIPGGLFN